MSRFSAPGRTLAGMALVLATGGCLGEPPIEERWTLLEIVEAPDLSAVVPGAASEVISKARITYREILTGSVIAEVRASSTIGAADVAFDQEEDRLAMARDVDYLLRNSTSIGFASRAVTGFDHLIQEMEFTFDAGMLPPSPLPDSTQVLPPTDSNLFFLVYFGDVDEVEIEGGMEIEVVTPTFSDEADILSVGMELLPPTP
ncbi:MAG: hypothetical protein DHS20C21_04400 [Gemmatimonadota bacterium]|nr:MAG: hypothetical protein DHS20C21_04400 [Gemmatimonadota bacterium]